MHVYTQTKGVRAVVKIENDQGAWISAVGAVGASIIGEWTTAVYVLLLLLSSDLVHWVGTLFGLCLHPHAPCEVTVEMHLLSQNTPSPSTDHTAHCVTHTHTPSEPLCTPPKQTFTRAGTAVMWPVMSRYVRKYDESQLKVPAGANGDHVVIEADGSRFKDVEEDG